LLLTMARIYLLLLCLTLLLGCTSLKHSQVTKTYHGYNEWGSHWSVWITPNVVQGDSVAIWGYSSLVGLADRGITNNLYLNNKYIKPDTALLLPQDVYTRVVPGKYTIGFASVPYIYSAYTKKLKLNPGDSVTVMMQFVSSMQNASYFPGPLPKFTRKERRMYKRYKKQQEKNE